MTDAVVLLGYKPSSPRREAIWEYARARWESLLGWPVFVGTDAESGPDDFCLAAASNRAAAAAGDWDVALYVGADWAVGTPEQVTRAAALALETDKLIFAHDRTHVLSEAASDFILSGVMDFDEAAWLDDDCSHHENTYSGAVAVSRTLWDAVGGFDERFVGWGWEDLAFWSSCCAVGGGFERIPGDLYHLWHPQDWDLRENGAHHNPNMVLGQRYLAAKWSLTEMLLILAERPVTPSR